MNPTRIRVWWILAAALFVSALLALPYAAHLVAQGPAGVERPPMARFLIEVGSTLLLGWPLAFAGLALAARLGLGAPLLEARIEHRPVEAARVLLPAILWGALVGGALLLMFAVFGGRLDQALAGRELTPPPWWAGVLGSFAAGVSEETMLRLFLLSALALPLSRALPRNAALWSANALAALAFGALHFGNVAVLGLPFTPLLVTFVLVVNGGVGLLCGWLFCTRGIEAAIACHVACDLVLHGLGAVLGGPGPA